ncbi:unnamed protein product, partial [Closterium sp. NIES-53]
MDASLWQEACHREFAICHPSHSPLAHLLLDSLPPSHSSVTSSPSSCPSSTCSTTSSCSFSYSPCSCSSAPSSSSSSSLLPHLPSPFPRIFPRAYLSPHRPYLCLAARLAHVLRGVARWRALIRYRRSSRPSRGSNQEGRGTWAWRAVPARVVMQGGVTIWVAFDLVRGGRGASSPECADGSNGRREETEGGVEDGGEGQGRGDEGRERGRAGGMGGMHEEEAMMVEVQGLWRRGGVGTGAMWVTLFRTHTDASCDSTHGAYVHGTTAAAGVAASGGGGAAAGREWVEDEVREGEEWEEEVELGGDGGTGAAGQWERVQQSHMTGLCMYSGHEWTLLASFLPLIVPPMTPPTTTTAAAASPSSASRCGSERAKGQQGGGDGLHGVVFLHVMHLLHCFPLPLPHSTPLCCPRPTPAASAASSSSGPPCSSLSLLIDFCLPSTLHHSILPSQAHAITLHAYLSLSTATPRTHSTSTPSSLQWEGEGRFLLPTHAMHTCSHHSSCTHTHTCTGTCMHACTDSSTRAYACAHPFPPCVLSDALADITLFS